MTKKLLDIEKLKDDLENKGHKLEGIICLNNEPDYRFGNYEIRIDSEKLSPYWVEIDI